MISRIMLLALVACLNLVVLSPPAAALVCGDVNGDGNPTISDLIYMMNYTYAGGPPPVDFAEADNDLYQGWSIHDASLLWYCIITWCGGKNLGCPPIYPPLEPAENDHLAILYPTSFPAGHNSMVMELAILADQPFSAFQLPLQIQVAGVTAHVDSVKFPLSDSYFGDALTLCDNDTVHNVFILASLQIMSNQGYSRLCSVFVSATPDASNRQITLEWGDYIPRQAPPGHDSPLAPMFIDYLHLEANRPILLPDCCLFGTDPNGDRSLSISDVVFMINFIFANGPEPIGCPQNGDADGSGLLTISDAVYLVGYIFSNGPAPICGAL
ncbi:MAG: hypothetical protein IT585_08670 [candidate division Zixibacteria bacterium]|nr:hypothetical protein [candidate division Zixibacteria bacterium]